MVAAIRKQRFEGKSLKGGHRSKNPTKTSNRGKGGTKGRHFGQ